MHLNRITQSTLALVGAAVILTACAGGTDAPTSPLIKSATDRVSLAVAVPIKTPLGQENFGEESFVVCKVISGGTATSANFLVEVDTNNDLAYDESAPLTLNHNECADYGQTYGGIGINFRVTETPITDYDTEWTSQTATRPSSGGALTLNPVSSPTATLVATGSAYGNRGANIALGTRIIFTNTYNPPPPGSQGCTPGYWKQSQHFGSWVGYATTDKFETVFARNAFPGDPTLLEVLGMGGGGINALGRHTVAALLNSANGGVNYGATPAQVIAAFQAAFDSGDLEAQKDIFAGWNERGCPLGRAELETTSSKR